MEKAGGKKRGRPRKGADSSSSPAKDEAAGEGAGEAGGRVTRKQAARRRPLVDVDANAGEKDGFVGLAAGSGRATRRTRLGEKQAKEEDAGNGDGHGKDGNGAGLQVMLESEEGSAPKPKKGRGRRAVQEGAAGEDGVVGDKAEPPPKSSGRVDLPARPPLKEVPGLPSTYEERLELIRRVSESINSEVEFRCEALKATLEMQLPAVMAQLKLQQAKFSAAQLRMPLVEFVEKYCTHCGIVEREDGSLEIRKFDTSIAGDVGNAWAEGQQQQDAAAAAGLQQVQGNVVPTPAPAMAAADFSAEKWATRGLNRDRDNRDLSEIMSAYIQASASRDYGALTSPTMATPAMWRRGSLFTGPPLAAALQPSRCGVTPRSERRPQRGELLMSINGSPLGHY